MPNVPFWTNKKLARAFTPCVLLAFAFFLSFASFSCVLLLHFSSFFFFFFLASFLLLAACFLLSYLAFDSFLLLLLRWHAACNLFSDALSLAALSLAVGWGRRIFVVLLYSNRDSDFCKGKKEDSSERLLCAWDSIDVAHAWKDCAVLLSVGRAQRMKLNGVCDLCFALKTPFGAPRIQWFGTQRPSSQDAARPEPLAEAVRLECAPEVQAGGAELEAWQQQLQMVRSQDERKRSRSRRCCTTAWPLGFWPLGFWPELLCILNMVIGQYHVWKFCEKTGHATKRSHSVCWPGAWSAASIGTRAMTNWWFEKGSATRSHHQGTERSHDQDWAQPFVEKKECFCSLVVSCVHVHCYLLCEAICLKASSKGASISPDYPLWCALGAVRVVIWVEQKEKHNPLSPSAFAFMFFEKTGLCIIILLVFAWMTWMDWMEQ